MISTAATVYLAPILSFISFILVIIAYVAPTIILHSQVALLVVSPLLELSDPSSSNEIDGPTVFLGLLGSCSRPNNNGPVTCTPSTVSPTYDLSVLPKNAPDLHTAPPAATPVFIAIAIALSALFLIIFTLVSLRDKLGPKLSAGMDRPMFHSASAWLGLLSFMIGKSYLRLTSFLVVRIWFGNAVDDFNRSIQEAGSNGPQLIAATGNGFTMVWVAYAFYAVSVISALTRQHVTFGGRTGMGGFPRWTIPPFPRRAIPPFPRLSPRPFNLPTHT
ncbi:hypothetical protein BGY98DRAFT_1183960 [Russula aff. rugulosa BPL654]|nr:hypothetical protein BGY98DRAFT_1183960 [Russula aff. rugulosa BPL654]